MILSLMHTKDNSITHEWYVKATLILTPVNTKYNSSTHESYVLGTLMLV